MQMTPQATVNPFNKQQVQQQPDFRQGSLMGKESAPAMKHNSLMSQQSIYDQWRPQQMQAEQTGSPVRAVLHLHAPVRFGLRAHGRPAGAARLQQPRAAGRHGVCPHIRGTAPLFKSPPHLLDRSLCVPVLQLYHSYFMPYMLHAAGRYVYE